jgi:protein TonB
MKRSTILIGIVGSILLHVGFLYGFNDKAPPAVAKAEEEVPLIEMEMPPLDEDKPEQVNDLKDESPDVLAPPTLVDLPTVVPINAFTQQIQPPPPPGIQTASTLAIPVGRTTSVSAMKEVFDLSNLDQAPVVKFQAKPVYPFELKRARVSGEVMVGFIVNTDGDVVEAYAVRSDVREFEAPAIAAVAKWKFKPGRKGNRAVNTKMQVPIGFSVAGDS